MRKYNLNNEVSVVSFIEEDILTNIKELTLVNEFDKDNLVVAISENSFSNELKKEYKNLILITNNDFEENVSYIKCNTKTYKEFVLEIINEMITLFVYKNLISIEASDLVKELRNKEVIFIKEKGETYNEISNNISKLLKGYDTKNIDTLFLNIYSVPNTMLVDINEIVKEIRKELKDSINLIFSTIQSDVRGVSLMLI